MTTVEKIQELLEDAATEGREATIKDVLVDLRRALNDCPEGDKAGLIAAIEIIEGNY